MKRGVDTYVLLYAHMPEAEHHVAVRSVLFAVINTRLKLFIPEIVTPMELFTETEA